MIQELDDGHLASQVREDRCKLQSDDPTAHNRQRFRQHADADEPVAADHVRIVPAHEIREERVRAGGQHNVLGVNLVFAAAVVHVEAVEVQFTAAHDDLPRIDHLGLSLINVDPVML